MHFIPKILVVIICFSWMTTHAQNVGIATTTPVAKLEIRGVASNPAIPGITSNGILRIGYVNDEAIDIGKMGVSPYSGWIQVGFSGNTTDPLALQPLGGPVAIGTTAPNNSAVLDVTSTSKGFLPPRMTLAQRNAITSPVVGLVVFCNNCGPIGELQVYSGSVWTNAIGGKASPVLALNVQYGGGVIVYIYQPGDPGYIAGQTHGLIVWFFEFVGMEWDCAGLELGVYATALGTGYSNTLEIANSCGPGTDVAADLCHNLFSNEGYFDWHLPSKDELNKLYINHSLIVPDYFSDNYWSSSEVNANLAWSQNFNTGTLSSSSKTSTYSARPVRYF